jgi:hypothetical protein
MKRKQQRRQGHGATELIEESVHLLRLAPAGILAVYYIGSLPFIIGFLYFWTEMSRSAFAVERCAEAAWAVACLFIWMKACHGVFAGMLIEHVRGTSESWPIRRLTRVLATQAVIQPTGLFVIPLALLITVPLAWTYAFYQNVTVLSGEPDADQGVVFRKALIQAQLWPAQNHILLALLGAFGVFVFLNLAIAVLQAPQLLNSLFGIETLFSQSLWGMLNTTFLAAVAGMTYLCIDPIVKAAYVLRCFYGQSMQSGEDLKVILRRVAGQRQAAAVFLAIVLWPTTLLAAPGSDPDVTEHSAPIHSEISSPELDRVIGEVISQREYTWRMPRIKGAPDENPGLIALFFRSMLDTLRSWFNAALELAKKIVDWIFEVLLKRFSENRSNRDSATGWINSLQFLLLTLLAVTAGALAIVLLRAWKRRGHSSEAIAATAVPSTPDLTDLHLLADQLPEDGWIKLGQELLERGELRLAIRAFYLAGLAHLGSRELIRIAKFKSNRDYERELRRRSPAEKNLHAAFSESVSVFDRIWYGMDDITDDLADSFRANLERITAC